MFARAPKYMTYAEYLAFEQSSAERHEWYDGEIFAMAGGTPEHAYLMAAITGELRNLLRGRPCKPFSSDLRLRSMATGLSTYSDAAVVCGAVVPHPEDADACTNPVVIVEVLSPSTEAYDRGKKFDHYQTFPTLRDYVLVATGRDHVDHYTLAPDGGWTRRGYGAGARVSLLGIDVTLEIDAIYAGVEDVRTDGAAGARG